MSTYVYMVPVLQASVHGNDMQLQCHISTSHRRVTSEITLVASAVHHDSGQLGVLMTDIRIHTYHISYSTYNPS